MIDEARAIWEGLEFRRPMLRRQVDPLNECQLLWVPGDGRRSIAWQLWHIAEVEDNWYRTLVDDSPPRFPLGCALAAMDNDTPPRTWPDKAQLIAYLDESRALCAGRLEAATAEQLGGLVRDPDYGQRAVRAIWAGIVTSYAWHAGQVALTAKLMPDSPVEVWDFTNWNDPRWRGGGTNAQ